MDPSHSEIAFKVKHLMITNIKGVFKDFSGSVSTSGGDFITADIEFSLNPASVDTGASDRDNHLKSADFFNVEKYGRLSFSGIKAEKTSDEKSYILYGDLNIRDVTKQIKLNVEFEGVMKDPWGNEKAGYTLTGKINRKEWGLNWNAALESGGVLVSDEVNISCDVQLVRLS